MTTFNINFLEGHVVAHIDKFDYIVDTGSPISFGRGKTIVINRKHFSIRNIGFGEFTPESISALSGLKVDGIIGMDIMNHFDVRFTRNKITFSNTPISPTNMAIVLPIIDQTMIVPIIILNIEHEDRRIFFDSGAKLSYLSEDLLVGTPIDEVEDFHPSIGTFKTNTYKIDVIIGDKVETLTFGLLPPSLRILLTMGQTKGIIGTELLNKYSIILSNTTRILALEPTNAEDSFDQYRNSNDEELQGRKNLTLVREPSLD